MVVSGHTLDGRFQVELASEQVRQKDWVSKWTVNNIRWDAVRQKVHIPNVNTFVEEWKELKRDVKEYHK